MDRKSDREKISDVCKEILKDIDKPDYFFMYHTESIKNNMKDIVNRWMEFFKYNEFSYTKKDLLDRISEDVKNGLKDIHSSINKQEDYSYIKKTVECTFANQLVYEMFNEKFDKCNK